MESWAPHCCVRHPLLCPPHAGSSSQMGKLEAVRQQIRPGPGRVEPSFCSFCREGGRQAAGQGRSAPSWSPGSPRGQQAGGAAEAARAAPEGWWGWCPRVAAGSAFAWPRSSRKEGRGFGPPKSTGGGVFREFACN